MSRTQPRPSEPTPAPQDFRDALAELVQIGLRVARMVGQATDAETALAEAASQAGVEEGVSPLAASLAEAIEADRAAAAAAETRQTVVARTHAIAAAFAQTARAIRLTVMLAERLDRGWARGAPADDQPTMIRRQIARDLTDAIERETERERAVSLPGARERLESLDTETGIGNRPTAEIIAEICHALGLDPARMTLRSPLDNTVSMVEMGQAAPLTAAASEGQARPPQRQPDG